MKAYSQDVRERVLRAVDQGIPRSEIVRVLGVSLASIGRYLKQRRETGHVQPKVIPGRPSQKVKPRPRWLAGATGSLPRCDAGATLSVLGTEPRDAGEQVEYESCSQRIGLDAKKKTFGATERDEAARAAYREYIKQLDANQVVVVDECGSNIALTPLYARAPKGKRASGSIPRNRGKNMTLIAALSRQGMTASMILDGAANGLAFEIYVEQVLAPSLTTGQIVVMDNLSIHKGVKVRNAIEARGCQLLFLPSYSPDLSPIEEAFSKLKAALRRASARTREALEEAICQALPLITAQDARGWFAHCGYLPAEQAS